MDDGEIESLRDEIALLLAKAGQILLTIRDGLLGEEDFQSQLMRPIRGKLFRLCVSDAASSVLQAMSCLEPASSPSTDYLTKALIARYGRVSADDKKHVIEELRNEFKKANEANKPATDR